MMLSIIGATTLALLAVRASGTIVDLKTSSISAKAILQSTNFDYIVVGGGTSGLTVARRLSENPKKKILVLEAGRSGAGDPLVTIPGNSFTFINTDIDWFYVTAPQKHGSGRVCNLSSGKVLGGDSSVNGLVWVRGPKAEYDAIESLGNPGWNWDVFYAAMRKAESLNTPSPDLTRKFGFQVEPQSLGSTGPIDVSFPDFLPIGYQKLVEASVELGHSFNRDAYSGNNTGVFYSLSSETARGVRDTSETGYLDPVMARDNLIVLSNAFVIGLEVKNVRGQVVASGVQVRFPDGSIHPGKVEPSGGEVILSSGTIRTPQLLELSGIGDPRVLTPLGIDVKVDLPGVGANFEDHTIVTLVYQLKKPFLSFDALGYNATLNAEQKALYKLGKGWLTFAQGVVNMEPAHVILTPAELGEARQLLRVKPPTISEDQFDVIKDQIFNGVPMVEYILFNSFQDGSFTTSDLKEPNRSYVSIAITHVHPLSRGHVHINTTSIDDHPVLDPNFFESEFDKWFLAKASAYGRKFFETDAMQEVFEHKETFPGANITTQAQWEEFVMNNVNGGYHTVGTASLLPRAKNGVVDSRLKVYGTANIRVADLSIMPLLLSAHTQPAAYAIGEIAANIIKNGHP
ncbi:hypothetical protein BDZ94DRAFT_1259269 [Collybia nuda]|uniref:Glucose-methanol-choline oxidoreductase N-terminal domain-containing protein n=1 Tax=Collybia nuda TaxID=64659 RepID=A0A9P6CEZ7_9AGAR|nr:hypothetical protein BDZ94DRAFT_1259269 [Collybia nuda]